MFRPLIALSIACSFFLPALGQCGNLLSADQKRRIMLLTTVFENQFAPYSTPAFNYDYVEDLHDGRGYTAGRIGFCTGTGDVLEVIEIYSRKRPGNILEQYTAALREHQKNISDQTSDLPNFVENWKQASADPLFREVQDDVADRIFAQANQLADELKIELPFGRAILFDTLVMHGDVAQDPDSAISLILRTNLRACAPPSTVACSMALPFQEKRWLKIFLEERISVLQHAHGLATQREWSTNVRRGQILLEMLESGRFDQLDQPLELDNEYFVGLIP